MILAVLAALLCCGCTLPTMQIDQDEVQLAIDHWIDRGLEYEQRCEDLRDDITQIEVSTETATERCRRQACYKDYSNPPHCVMACFVPLSNTIVIVEGYNERETRLHELMHWLDWCSYNNVDLKHKKLYIWGDGGVLDACLADFTAHQEAQ